MPRLEGSVSNPPTVLVLDDQGTSRAILAQVINTMGDGTQVAEFERPSAALEWATHEVAQLALVDFQMPEMDGIQFMQKLRSLDGYGSVPVLMVTSETDAAVRFNALEAGVSDFLNKPINVRECRARCQNLLTMRKLQLELQDRAETLAGLVQRATAEVRARERETLIRLAKAGEYRDEETGNHVLRMAKYSAMISEAAGMDARYVETIERAAPLHDIGKIGVPDNILLKPAKLAPSEWEIMSRHPVIGYEILRDSPSKYVHMGAEIALGHHEKYDGSGYPNGLKGDAIPLAGRIVAIADVYDALTSARPYKDPWSSEKALALIADAGGKHFDPRLASIFISLADRVKVVQRSLQDSPLAKEPQLAVYRKQNS